MVPEIGAESRKTLAFKPVSMPFFLGFFLIPDRVPDTI